MRCSKELNIARRWVVWLPLGSLASKSRCEIKNTESSLNRSSGNSSQIGCWTQFIPDFGSFAHNWQYLDRQWAANWIIIVKWCHIAITWSSVSREKSSKKRGLLDHFEYHRRNCKASKSSDQSKRHGQKNPWIVRVRLDRHKERDLLRVFEHGQPWRPSWTSPILSVSRSAKVLCRAIFWEDGSKTGWN